MSKASEFAIAAKQWRRHERPAWGWITVTDDGGLDVRGTEYPPDDVPELIAWLIDTFEVGVTATIMPDTSAAEIDLLRRKLARAMETLGEYVKISFDGRNIASRAIVEIEAMR